MDKPRNDMQSDRILGELARSLQESQRIAGLGSYTLDLETRLWSSSDVLDEILGIEADYERYGRWLKRVALIHPEDHSDDMAAYFRQEVASAATSASTANIASFAKAITHAPLGPAGMGRLERDEAGKAILMRGSIQDITERESAPEGDLRCQSEELLQLFIQHAPAAYSRHVRSRYALHRRKPALVR